VEESSSSKRVMVQQKKRKSKKARSQALESALPAKQGEELDGSQKGLGSSPVTGATRTRRCSDVKIFSGQE